MVEVDLLRRGVTLYRHTTIDEDRPGRRGLPPGDRDRDPRDHRHGAARDAVRPVPRPRRGHASTRTSSALDPARARIVDRALTAPATPPDAAGLTVEANSGARLDPREGRRPACQTTRRRSGPGHPRRPCAAATSLVTTAPGADDRLVADRHSHVDHGVRADEDAVSDRRRARARPRVARDRETHRRAVECV